MKVTHEQGQRTTASLERAANSTYYHIPTGKLYIQTAIPSGDAWKEDTLGLTKVDGVTIQYNSEGELESLAAGGEYTPTEINPNTIDFYVSNDNGDDLNDGLTPSTALKTIGAAKALLDAKGDGRAYIFASNTFYDEDLMLATIFSQHYYYFEFGAKYTFRAPLTDTPANNYFSDIILNIEGNGELRYIGADTFIDTTDCFFSALSLVYDKFSIFPTSPGVTFIKLGAIGDDVIDVQFNDSTRIVGTSNSVGSHLISVDYNNDEGFKFFTDIFFQKRLQVGTATISSNPVIDLSNGSFIIVQEDQLANGDIVDVQVKDVVLSGSTVNSYIINAEAGADSTEVNAIFTGCPILRGEQTEGLISGAEGVIKVIDCGLVNVGMTIGRSPGIGGAPVIIFDDSKYEAFFGIDIWDGAKLVAKDTSFTSVNGGSNVGVINTYEEAILRISDCIFPESPFGDGIAFEQAAGDDDAVITNTEFAVAFALEDYDGPAEVHMHNVVGPNAPTVNDPDSGFTVMTSMIDQEYP